MAKTNRIPVRKDVPKEVTWDLTPLYKSDAAWERAYKALEKKVEEFSQFRGKLASGPKVLRACFDFEVAFEKEAERLGSYAYLKSAEDVANSTYQAMVARYMRLATRAGEEASYIAPEIQAIPRKRMASYLKSPLLKDFRFQLEKLLRYRPHILSQSEERLLAMQGEVAGTASRVFGQLTDADMKFGEVTNEDGVKVELTQESFRTLLESKKRSVRKAAFHKFYEQFEGHANTLAAALSSSVLQDVYYARVRNYTSARESSLFADNVPVSVYDNLIETVHENLPVVYRYLELRRRALRVKSLHFYDTYLPIVEARKTRISYDEAVGMVLDAVQPLGAAYVNTLGKGLRGRWVDRYENKGKRSGAFSGGGYTGPPYILLNYKDTVLNSVFTLAHEAGHSMHTYYSVKNQPFHSYDYTIFVAEVASTFNEQLLSHHLLENARDKTMRAYLLCREIDEIRGTVVRQTMFAEYEKIIHALAEANEPLTVERLRAEYRKLLDLYFGPDTVINKELEMEGLRIPHFYRAFYVYKYATGLSAAVALSRHVLEGGAKERARYLAFLGGGGSKFPLDLLRDAGVDMAKPEPVAETMAHFEALVDELATLL